MISLELDHNSAMSLYAQIYQYLKEEISEGSIEAGEKLPSLRSMSKLLGVSITTVSIAYDQLIVEGYLESKPNSGFYAVRGAGNSSNMQLRSSDGQMMQPDTEGRPYSVASCDPESFDFTKWKKCMASVLNERPELLLTEADRQGEPALRKEISDYLFKSRGVVCTPDQVIISAGTQQLVNHVARLLRLMNIGHVCTEDPGYLPVRSIFRDWGFSLSCIPVKQDGIVIEKLPVNIRTAVYICPQNQFPTGAVMPISRRRRILEWAEANDSIVIEDDYNSELRYFGMPVPALQGLDHGSRVVYIGSFTSTLFPAVRISYMVLPESMMSLYDEIRMNYDQTCSKTEQLTLALFMQRGYYQTNLRKVRKLYSRKLKETLAAISEYDTEGKFISADNSQSGLNVILRINTRARTMTEGSTCGERTGEIRRELAARMTKAAAELGLKIRDIDQLDRDGQIYLIFYYTQIPLDRIRNAVGELIDALKAALSKGSLSMPSVYEVIRIKNGKPVFLKEHYERLENSLASLGMLPPFTYEELKGHIEAMIQENSIVNHNLKMEVDISGYSVIYMSPSHYPSREMYEKGVRTDLFRGERKNPNIKMMDQELRDATDKAIKAGKYFEVFLVDRNGNITEGSRSNIFFIKGNKLYTSPASQVLLGVTRREIIDIIHEMKLGYSEEALPSAKIANFDAAFISGTSPEVLPIESIGNHHYDVNNSVLRDIMKRFRELQYA